MNLYTIGFTQSTAEHFKPWVKCFQVTTVGLLTMEDVVIEPH